MITILGPINTNSNMITIIGPIHTNSTKITILGPMHTKSIIITQVYHTDRSELQLSRVLTKNYSTSPRVPMGTWVSGGNPITQIKGFGCRPSSFKRTRSQKPLKNSHFWSKTTVFEWFFSSSSFKTWWSGTKPLNLGYGHPSIPTSRYPWVPWRRWSSF